MKRILPLLLAAIMLLSGCAAPASSQDNSQTEATLVTEAATSSYTLQDVQQLNVGAIYEMDVENFTGNIMQMLGFEGFCFVNPVRMDKDFNIVPNFAESYEIADDGMSITFQIRTDAKWHDGVPVTAEDFKFSIDYAINVTKTMKTYFESADILDESHVRVNLKSTCPVVALRHWTFWNRNVLLPKHIWENVEDPATYTGEGAMVGCGPYVYEGYDPEAKIMSFTANEEFYGGVPTIKRISFKLYENKESIIMALKNGEIDCFYQYATGLNGQYADAVNALEGFDPGLVYNMGVPMIAFNMSETGNSDLAVRSAVSAALDYEMLASTLGNGYATVGGKGVLNPLSAGYDETIPQNKQDIEGAKAILDEAGYKDVDGDGFREDPQGQPFEQVIVPQQSKSIGNLYDRIAQILVRDLKNVGIRASIKEEVIGNADKYKEVIKAHDYSIHIVGTTGGANYIDTAFKYLSTERTGYYGGTLSDPAFFDLYFGLLDSTSVEEYTDYRTKLQHYVADNLVAITIGWDQMFYPYNTDRFEGWVVREGHGPFCYETWFSLQEKV